MIVCVCNNVSDKKIRQAVEEGMSSMAELRRHLNVATCCGKCHTCAREVLQTCLQQGKEAAHIHAQALSHQPLIFMPTRLAA